MTSKTFSLRDNSTGEQVELDVKTGTIGPDVIDVSSLYSQTGVFTYDPGFASTASCSSSITYIDGEKGILLYRGCPIEQLAQKSSFLEVAYLLLNGELPGQTQLEAFIHSISSHTMMNETLLRLFNGFHTDAHPMAKVAGVVGSMSSFAEPEIRPL